MSNYRFTDLAQSLPASVPFVGPETQERQRGAPFLARLGANESVFGPSPKAISAMREAAATCWMYGDPENYDLRHALAEHHDIKMENIVVGEGVDGLLGYLARLFVAPGDAVVTSDGAYPTFNYHVAGFGGVLHKAAYKNDHEDPDALLDLAREAQAKLIYLSNPDNPMGTWHSAGVIEEMTANLPQGCVLVLDEAYIDLAPENAAPIVSKINPNVIRMRTFSKGYGMAGARVGYGIGTPELITAFNKIRNHFGVSRIAQAGALAALADQAYLTDIKSKFTNSRGRIGQIAQQNGLVALPSATNFVTLDCGRDGDFSRRVLAHLISEGLFVRMPFVAPQDRAVRISCGTDAQMDLVAEKLPKALKAAAG